MKKILLTIALAMFASVSNAAGAELVAPDVLARSVTDEVLAAVRSDKDLQTGNQKKVLELVEAKVLPHFNFTRMAQLAMGKNWRQATPEQRDEITREFRALLVRTYTAAFTQYKNQTVQYRPLRLAPEDTDALVRSSIIKPDGPPIAVDYSMEKTPGGWKVYNIKVEGISLVENYRNTFNSEIQRNGIDGLIRALTGKNKSQVQAQVSTQ